MWQMTAGREHVKLRLANVFVEINRCLERHGDVLLALHYVAWVVYQRKNMAKVEAKDHLASGECDVRPLAQSP